MPTINIKPLSVNSAWQGRRYKTPSYSAYEKELLFRLPPLKIPSGKLFVTYHIGYSNKMSDLGNMEKPFTDILCKKYGFDDRDIYKFVMTKQIVKKGSEFISFEIRQFDETELYF